MLDKIDKKILYELDINSRTPSSELSRKLKIPKETVTYRINRLTKNGYIKRFYALFNSSLLGYNKYKINLRFRKLTKKVENSIITYIMSHPSCLSLVMTEGAYDCSFLILKKNIEELKQFIEDLFFRFGENIQEKDIYRIIRTTRVNQKFLLKGASHRLILETKDELELDETDYQLIHFLSTNSRTKLTSLARTMNSEPNLLRYRIKRLEKIGVISGYVTALNLENTGLEKVELSISVTNPSKIPAIIEFFDSMQKLLYAYELVGRYDLTVELYVQNDSELRNVLAEFRENFLNDYTNYRTSHVYSEYSTNWSPFK